jgi:hypothetical protein
MKEVIDDIQRCFDNCLLFNGEDSLVGDRCMKVVNEFKKLYQQLNCEFYMEEIPLGTPLDQIS